MIKIPEELFAFAKSFSDNYKILTEGRYTSAQNNFCIDYIFIIKNSEGNSAKTFFRTVNTTGKIEADKSLLYRNEKITSNFVFYMVVWCAIFTEKKKSYIEIDNICLQYYASLGLPSNDVEIGFKEVLETSLGHCNTERYSNLIKNISEQKNS